MLKHILHVKSRSPGLSLQKQFQFKHYICSKCCICQLEHWQLMGKMHMHLSYRLSMIMCLGHPPTPDSSTLFSIYRVNVSQSYAKTYITCKKQVSYDIVLIIWFRHFLLLFSHPLLRRFGQVQDFFSHLDVQLAITVWQEELWWALEWAPPTQISLWMIWKFIDDIEIHWWHFAIWPHSEERLKTF